MKTCLLVVLATIALVANGQPKVSGAQCDRVGKCVPESRLCKKLENVDDCAQGMKCCQVMRMFKPNGENGQGNRPNNGPNNSKEGGRYGKCSKSTSCEGTCRPECKGNSIATSSSCGDGCVCCVKTEKKKKCTNTSCSGKCKKRCNGKFTPSSGVCGNGCVCCEKSSSKKCPGFCKRSPSCGSSSSDDCTCCTKQKKCTNKGGRVISGSCQNNVCCYFDAVPGSCSCGRAGGGDAHPWVARVQVSQTKETSCLATVLDSRTVVTSGNCLFYGDSFAMRTPEDIEVVAPGSSTVFQVEEIVLHPDFDFFDASFNVAVLRLSSDMPLSSSSTVPVCLPEDASRTYEGESGTAIGPLQNATAPSELQASVLTPDCGGKQVDCWPITEQMLCARLSGVDTCLGNVGGPLTVQEGDTHVLVGIFSFGKDCEDPLGDKVFVRVTEFADWMKGLMTGSSCEGGRRKREIGKRMSGS